MNKLKNIEYGILNIGKTVLRILHSTFNIQHSTNKYIRLLINHILYISFYFVRLVASGLRKYIPGFKKLPTLAQKVISIILAITITITGTGLLSLIPPLVPKTQAAWFDDSFSYRKQVTVTVASSASDITFLDTLITVDTDDLITAGKLQSACQDLRFTSQNGKLLPYLIDSGCNGNSTKIWVKADLVPKNTTTYSMYMYYGNPSAVAGSNSAVMNIVNGLIAYWTMNDSASPITDSTPNGFDATFGATDSLAAGQYGNALTNTGAGAGASYAYSASSALDFISTTKPSIAFWYKSSTGSQSTRFIEAVAANGWGLEIISGVLKINTFGGSTGDFGYTMPTDGAWHNLVVTYDGTNARLYVDGALNTTIAYTAGWATGGKTLYILGDASFPTTASIDDLRIYNRVLSSDEILQNYNSPSSISSAALATSEPSTAFATEEKGPTPIGYWQFDEGQGTTASDATTNNLDGTLSGPTWQTEDQCIAGKCLWFDGSNDEVTITDNAALDFTGDFTISAWILRNGGAGATIVSKTNDSSDGGYAMLIGSSGEIYCRTTNGSGSDNSSTATGILPADSTWHHALIVRSGTSCNVYFDGQNRTNTVDTHTTMTANSNDLKVGTRPNEGGEFWNGKIDEVKIYNFALSDAQIKANYIARSTEEGASQVLGQAVNNQPGALSNGLAGYWKMDEASWTVDCATESVLDSSGNVNNGAACPNTTGPAGGAVGKFGNAGSFDGTNDYVDIDNATSLNLNTSDRTIAGWVMDTSANFNHDSAIIMMKGDSDADGSIPYYSRIYYNEFQACVRTGFGSLDTNCAVYDLSTDSEFAVSRWFHYSAVYTEATDTIQLYLNGKLKDTSTVTFPSAGNTSPLILGANTDQAFFTGRLDESRVYSRALSAADAAQLYNYGPGPVGYWRMDEPNGNASDASGYGNNLTNNNTATFTPGKFGKTSDLENTGTNNTSRQYFSIADASANGLEITGPITMEAWINGESFNPPFSATLMGKSFDKSSDDNLGYSMDFNTSGSSGRLRMRLSSAGTSYDGSLESGTNITPGTWYHLAGVYDGSTIKLYINGVLDSSTSYSSGIFNSSGFFSVGSIENNTGATFHFDGKIDDAKIYNYARTAGQVVQDMNAGHPAPGSPVGSPLGFWKFDEGAANMCSGGTNDACNSGSQASALDGAFNGNTAYSNSGKFGKAASFDGTGDYIAVTDQTALDITGTLTISAWVNPSANNSFNDIVTKLAGAGTEAYALYAVSGAPKFEVSSNGSATTAVTSSQTMSTGTWYHVAAVYVPSTSLTIYVNGIQTGQNTTSIPSAIFSSTANLNIGSENSGGTAGWNGYIDEVKIYDSALTASQIQMDMNRGSGQVQGALSTSSTAGNDNASTRTAQSGASEYCVPGDSSTCTAPVLRYDLEEGTGTTAYDTSTNSNTGTTTGAVYVAGKVGKGLDFDGSDDYIDVANESTFDFADTTFTVSGWFKADSGAAGYIAGKMDGTNQGGWGISYNTQTSNKISAVIKQSTNATAYFRDTSNNYSDTNWHHFEVVFTTSTSVTANNDAQIYIDGRLDNGTETETSTYGTNSVNLFIGKRTSGNQFEGLIDQVRVFGYGRTTAQVAWDYNQGKPIAHWKMDECQGTTINDVSVNAAGTGNNGLSGVLTIGASGEDTIGTCSTSSTAWGNGVTGKRNSAIDLDGTDDYITVADNSKFDFGDGDFALSAWVKRDTTNSKDIIISKDNSTGSTRQWHLVIRNDNSNKITVSYAKSGDSEVALDGTSSFTDTGWHHILGQRRGNSFDIYIDGRLDATGTTTGSHGTMQATATDVQIGRRPYASFTDEWDGMLDDVRVYNYSLTPQQIQMALNEGAVRRGPVTGAP